MCRHRWCIFASQSLIYSCGHHYKKASAFHSSYSPVVCECIFCSNGCNEFFFYFSSGDISTEATATLAGIQHVYHRPIILPVNLYSSMSTEVVAPQSTMVGKFTTLHFLLTWIISSRKGNQTAQPSIQHSAQLLH